jgi:virginiamycin B lyase
MMTDRMYLLNAESGAVDEVPVPVQRANPRAVELAANGDWWVLLGAANKVARYQPASREWSSWDVGMYGHSITIDAERGRVWFNGHFTRDPAKVGYVDAATGEVRTIDAPRHPTLAARPGGPIPYELRLGPDGTVWYSELQGNRILGYAPATGEWRTFDMPTTASGPRRFREYPLPIADAVPYVARVDQASGRVWIGTSAADAVLVFDPATERFTTIHLPSRGAMIRHMAINPETHDVWLAYGASPGIPARVARVRLGATPAG